jgi:protein TonB
MRPSARWTIAATLSLSIHGGVLAYALSNRPLDRSETGGMIVIGSVDQVMGSVATEVDPADAPRPVVMASASAAPAVVSPRPTETLSATAAEPVTAAAAPPSMATRAAVVASAVPVVPASPDAETVAPAELAPSDDGDEIPATSSIGDHVAVAAATIGPAAAGATAPAATPAAAQARQPAPDAAESRSAPQVTARAESKAPTAESIAPASEPASEAESAPAPLPEPRPAVKPTPRAKVASLEARDDDERKTGKPAETSRRTARPPAGKAAPEGAEANSRAGAAEGGDRTVGVAARGAKSGGAAAARSTYFGEVRARVRRHLFHPEEKRAVRTAGVATVEFTIAPSGALAGVRVASSSGSPVLDAAAMEIVRRSAPFPPIPAELGGKPEGISVPLKFDR